MSLGLDTSGDRILKVLVLVLNTTVLALVLIPKVSVLVLNTTVLALVLIPKVSVLVLKLGLGLRIVFWQLNNDFVLRWIFTFVIPSRHHLSTKLT